MKSTNFFSRNMALIVACLTILTVLSGCDPKDKTPNPITVADARQLEQTVFADKTSGASTVNINTTGAWTSTIAEKTQAKENAPSPAPAWISISPDRGDKAGNYSIAITLAPNYSGADRTAIVTISCLGATATVTVTQRATKDDGTEYEWFNRTITGHIVDAGANVTTVKALTVSLDGEATELVSAPCQNGNFTITLPKTVESQLLYTFADYLSQTVQLSDDGVRVLDVFWNDDISLRSADEKVEARLIYSDRDCNVTGHYMEGSVRTDLNMELKKGWNWYYGTFNDNGNLSIASTKPDVELQWYVKEKLPEPFNPVVSGHIVNGNNVAEVRLLVEVAQVGMKELAVTTCQNGDFTIVLPDTVDHELLYPLGGDDVPNTIRISDIGLHILDRPWFTTGSGGLFFGSADGKVEAELAYVDRDATVTGYVQEEDTRIEYDWDLKAGWNWMYVTSKDANTVIFSTTKPDVELLWTLDDLTRRR